MTPNTAALPTPGWMTVGKWILWCLWQVLQGLKLLAWLLLILVVYKRRFPPAWINAVQHYVASFKKPAAQRRDSSMTNPNSNSSTTATLRAPRSTFEGLCSFASANEIELAGQRLEYARIFKKDNRPKPESVLGMLVTALVLTPQDGKTRVCAIEKIVPSQETPSSSNEAQTVDPGATAPSSDTSEPTDRASDSDRPREERQEAKKKPSEGSLKFLEDLRKERGITEAELATVMRIRHKEEDFSGKLEEASPRMVRKAIDYFKR